MQVARAPEHTTPSLSVLLGDVRAQIVDLLRARPDQSVTELADTLGISAVATRRHVTTLENDGLIVARTVKQQRGRPAARYRVTDAANRLLPHRYDAFANELVEFLIDRYGAGAMREFLRWRMERETSGFNASVTGNHVSERLEQLAEALSRAGFDAHVDKESGRFRLVQQHCAIEDVARKHPEVCAYEAATFSHVLGEDVTLSRRETMAGGASACVCTVTPRTSSSSQTANEAAPSR